MNLAVSAALPPRAGRRGAEAHRLRRAQAVEDLAVGQVASAGPACSPCSRPCRTSRCGAATRGPSGPDWRRAPASIGWAKACRRWRCRSTFSRSTSPHSSMASKWPCEGSVATAPPPVSADEGGELGGAVHQRRGGERRLQAAASVARGDRRQHPLGRPPRAGSQRRRAEEEVAAAAEHEEQVLLAPHHALGHAGGAAGVEDAAGRRRSGPRAPSTRPSRAATMAS